MPPIGPRRNEGTAGRRKSSNHRSASKAAAGGDQKHNHKKYQHTSSAIRSAYQRCRRRIRMKNKGLPSQNPIADDVEPTRAPRQKMLEPVEFEAVNRKSCFGIDERKRNHSIEKEVVRVAPRSSVLGGIQPSREGQSSKNPKVFLW